MPSPLPGALVACLSTLCLVGCATGGQIYVSRPQVFTRERLVEERYRDSEWARKKLDAKEFDAIKPVNAGLHEFRSFAGITASLSAELTPKATATTESGPAATAQPLKAPAELATGAGIPPSDAKLDAIQELEFQDVVRSRINGMLRQSQLDDTHDLAGNTMYRLQFQIAVVPGRSTSEFGVVQIRIRGPHDFLCEHVDLANESKFRPYVNYFKQLRTALDSADVSPDTATVDCVDTTTPECLGSLNELKSKLCQRVYADGTFVVDVEPHEYAQNISEVAAGEQFAQLIAAVQATSPASVSGQGYVEGIRKSLELSHALRQQPLVVGYASGHDTFGWVVGPPFVIDDEEATWQHFPKYYSVSAAISVPAWWPWILLDGRVGWRSRDGTTSWNRSAWYRWPWLRSSGQGENATSSELRTFDSRVDSDQRDAFYRISPRAPMWGGELKVQLPGDVRAISSGQRYDTAGRTAFKPTIREPKQNASGEALWPLHLKATACSADATRGTTASRVDQSIYIRGDELWRSAQVYVGAQRASRVDVLPDMKGLVAHFEDVVFPTEAERSGNESSPQDLRVVTSIDECVVRRAVVIHRAACPKAS